MPRAARHVVPSKSGWSVKAGGRTVSNHRTQKAAASAAKAGLRKNGGGEAVIHNQKGVIRASDTVGRRDPFPPRG